MNGRILFGFLLFSSFLLHMRCEVAVRLSVGVHTGYRVSVTHPAADIVQALEIEVNIAE